MTMLRSCWLVSQGLTLAAVVSGQSFANMAGYTPVSDVVEHSELDLDMQKLEAAADAFDFATAYEEYSVGGESDKSDGTIRTIQGFSTAAEGKLDAEYYFKIYEAYWGDPAYADVFTSDACLGTGTFAGASNLTRSEGCLKGAQYQNVWMYVIHELEDAVVDCNGGDVTANGGGVVAWDEGWAFYAGSLEGTAVGGSTDGGQMIYALAEKRCENFGTCDATGVSEVNNELLVLWTRGQAHLEALECDDAASVIEEIVPLMTVPLVQGLLRYFYEADPAVVDGTVPDKEAAELWAFSAAVLPLIDSCDAAVATTVRDNTDIANTQTAPMSAGFESLKAELETVYGCLGITCAQVGGYIDETTGEPFAGFEACEDAASAGNGTIVDIAGYTPGSDVVEHSELDLDMANIEAGADQKTAEGFTAAFTAYSEGGASEKDGGVIRTIQGFSTEADGKLDGELYFEIWKGYWNDTAYADTFTSSACQGTGDFEGASMLTRSEGCLKGAQYQNVWMYVIHELEDAVNDCVAGDISDNDGGVHAWDEGWAFYAGSLEGTAVGGSTTDEGQMIYALAEKRCENFGTCDADGVSNVNVDLLDLWTQGKTHLEEGACDDAAAVVEEIVPLMAVPLVQGLLRYTYEADPAVVGGTVPDKEASELWAFSAAILPWIDNCDTTVAEVVRANTDITSADAPMSAGFASVKADLETVYECMRITCAQVGGYIDETTDDYFAGFEPCVGSDSAFADIAGYTPGSDVVEHSELDLDMAGIEAGADQLTAEGFTAAFTAYSEGGASEKDGGVIRTIQGFSTEADGKLDGELYFEIWKDYWNDPAYADTFTSSACQGTGDFEGASMLTRSEGCLKGAQYQNVWMYVIHELEDAVNDCKAGDISDNDGGVHAWDEGWAFYAGSLEGTAVGGSTTDEGQMIYALAEKRCENFGTCDADGVSNVNVDLLDLWTQGKTHLEEGACDDAAAVVEEIVPLMAVPLVQGLLRYTYEADPAVMGDVAELDKEASELWAFSAAILPWIYYCDTTVAEVVRANTDIANTATAPMSDGFASVKAQLETVYDCMDITCSQVGGYIDETTNDYFAGFEPCAGSDSDSDSGDSGDRSVSAAGDSDSGDSLDGGGIAGVTIAVAAVAAAVVVGFVLIKRKNARDKAAAVDDNLGNF